jgi:hypothetical protein
MYYSYLRVSRRSESINNHRIVGKPDQHYDILMPTDRRHMAIFHNNIIGSIRVSRLTSACFHVIPHTILSVCGPYTIPVNISKGMVWYRPTTTIIKLYRFTKSHEAIMRSVQFKYLPKVPLRTVLNQHRQWLPLWRLKYPPHSPRPFHSKILRFQLVATSVLKLNHQQNLYQKSFLIPLVWKGVLHASVTYDSDFYRYLALSTAPLTTTYSYKGNKYNMEW